MNYRKFLSKRYLAELATIKNKHDPKALEIAINSYLSDKNFDLNKEPQLASDINTIFSNNWNGDWEEFLNAVHRKYLNITTTGSYSFSDLKKLMKKNTDDNFFELLFKIVGQKKPERGNGEVILSLLFKNLKDAPSGKGDITNGKRKVEIKAVGKKSGWRAIGSTRGDGFIPYNIIKKKIGHFINKYSLNIDIDELFTSNALSVNLTPGNVLDRFYKSLKSLDDSALKEFIKNIHQYGSDDIVKNSLDKKLKLLKSVKNVEEFRKALAAIHLYSYVIKENIDSLGIWRDTDKTLFIISHEDLTNLDSIMNVMDNVGIKIKEGIDKRKSTFKFGF